MLVCTSFDVGSGGRVGGSDGYQLLDPQNLVGDLAEVRYWVL
jgi:hypothetical protein